LLLELACCFNILSIRRYLMQDFVSIITSFVSRLYGKRRSKRLTEKIIKKIVNE
jgi:predicted site-specific integrase-resolvase